MYEWRITEPGDVESLRIHRWDEFGIGMQSTLSSRLPELAYKYTLLWEGKPYAVVFGYYVSEGVCELFAVSDVSIVRHGRNFFETCIALMKDPAVRRWQTHVDIGNDISCSMAEKLGLTLEGQLAGFYPHCDAYIYGKVN